MSKKNKKKGNNKNQTKQKDIQPNVEIHGKLGLLLKHHILFWMLIFPPVAIYRLFKYKIVGKFAGAILIICLLVILAFSTISVLNPTLVIDTQVSNKMEDMGYGTVRDVEYLGVYQDLYVSEVITTTGFYTVYYDYSDDDNLFMNTIIELYTEIEDDLVYNEFVVSYQSEKSNPLLLEINPAAIKFLIQNNDYGEIQSVEESTIGSQVLLTTKGTYQFNYQYYETTNIQKLSSDNVWEDVMNRDYIIKMKDEFQNALNQKNVIPLYYKVEEVIAYGITEDEIYYIFVNFCGNKYRIVKFNDGRITLEHAVYENPVAQEDLAEMWDSYQNGQLEE